MTEWSDRSEPEVAELLAELRVDPADDGFSASLSARLARAVELKPTVPRWRSALVGLGEGLRARPWVVGTFSGAFAGAAVFALLQWSQGPVPPRSGRSPQPLVQIAAAPAALCPPVAEVAAVEVFPVPAGKVALVHFQFEVERAVEAAEFSVLLPPGLSFYSDGEPLKDRVFRWEAPLSAGENRVPVAILGELPGPHRVTATATVGSEVVVHELVLDVQGAA